MHSAMKEQPRITVGQSNADLIGADNRALQAAVDYVAALGGGTVEIGPGTYAMRDSLHLRPHVTVRGVKGQTILRKADAISSPLVRDGDYGEEQATVKTPAGFDVGCGVAIGQEFRRFHITVARITGRNGNTFSSTNRSTPTAWWERRDGRDVSRHQRLRPRGLPHRGRDH
jgi:polygalacturonase